MPKRRHPVYTVFDTDAEANTNKCQNCQTVIKGSHTSNLMAHLRAKHLRVYEEIDDLRNNRDSSETPSSQTSIESFTESGKLPMVTLEITAEEMINILIEQICVNGRPLSSIEDSGIVKILHPIMRQLGNHFYFN